MGRTGLCEQHNKKINLCPEGMVEKKNETKGNDEEKKNGENYFVIELIK